MKCTGDLLLEDDEWRCLQCGRYYYPECSPVAEEEEDDGHARRRQLWRKYASDDRLPTVQEIEALLTLPHAGIR